MRWGIAAALVVAIATGCNPDGETPSGSVGQPVAAAECEWMSAIEPEDANAALCDLEFREVVRLEGSIDGIAPDHPVRVLRDGTFVSGTYSRGKLALWGQDGRLLDVLGTGPGDGPGEFDFARSFAQVGDDEFFVFAKEPLVHKFSTVEGFMSSFRLPVPGWDSSDAMYGDFLILSLATADSVGMFDGWGAFLMNEDGVVQALEVPLGPERAFSILSAAQGVGLWSANTDRYVFRRHSWPGGAMADSLVVVREWFPDPAGDEAVLEEILADGRGLIWAAATVPDLDLPPGRHQAQSDAPIGTFEDFEAYGVEYKDITIEAFTPDGRLVASVRFDSFLDAPRAMPGGLWYRATDDRMSVVILEAALVGRE